MLRSQSAGSGLRPDRPYGPAGGLGVTVANVSAVNPLQQGLGMGVLTPLDSLGINPNLLNNDELDSQVREQQHRGGEGRPLA